MDLYKAVSFLKEEINIYQLFKVIEISTGKEKKYIIKWYEFLLDDRKIIMENIFKKTLYYYNVIPVLLKYEVEINTVENDNKLEEYFNVLRLKLSEELSLLYTIIDNPDNELTSSAKNTFPHISEYVEFESGVILYDYKPLNIESGEFILMDIELILLYAGTLQKVLSHLKISALQNTDDDDIKSNAALITFIHYSGLRKYLVEFLVSKGLKESNLPELIKILSKNKNKSGIEILLSSVKNIAHAKSRTKDFGIKSINKALEYLTQLSIANEQLQKVSIELSS